ncbi:MAG: MFS transporter [Bacteroidales bacterium]|nr:MFS transporter [Bacteroidales bacterium]
MSKENTSKLPIVEKIGYSLGDTATNIAWRPLVAFLPFFYTDVFGLPAAAVTWLLLIPRFSDGVTDLIMGAIADRTNTRNGKFRPWILWTAIPFGLLLALTFTTPNLSITGKLIWAYSTYILLTLVYTASNVPYNALLGVMTSNHNERTNLSSFRFFGAFAGGALAYFLIDPFVRILGKGTEADGYKYAFFIFGFMLALFLVITYFTCKERITPMKNIKTNLNLDFKDALNNKPWLIILVVGVLWVIYNSFKQGIVFYYFTHYCGKGELKGIYLGVLVLVSMGAALITPQLSKLFDKKKLFMISMILSGVFTLILYFIPGDQTTAIFIIGSISEVGAAIFPILYFAMLADTADYSEFKNGRRATALIFSAGTFAMKSGGAIAGGLMVGILGWFGYAEGGVEQNQLAVQGIRLNMSIIPAVIIFITTVILAFYPLNRKKMNEIEEALEIQRSKENYKPTKS